MRLPLQPRTGPRVGTALRTGIWGDVPVGHTGTVHTGPAMAAAVTLDAPAAAAAAA